MTIIQLQYFVSVCEYGSISKASSILHVSSPTISVAIKDLENEFNILLFTRINKQMVLTLEGEFVYRHASQLLKNFDELAQQIGTLGNTKNDISIAMPPTAVAYGFHTLIANFCKEFPQASYHIYQASKQRAFFYLDSGDCDLAIVLDDGEIPDKYIKVPIYSTDFCFCVHKDNEAFNNVDSIDILELKDCPLILGHKYDYITRIIRTTFAEVFLKPNVISYGLQYTLLSETLFVANAGTFLSRKVAESIPNIKTIELKKPIICNYVLIKNRDSFTSKTLRSCYEYLATNGRINSKETYISR